MIRIKFFASLRESLGTSEEIIEINNIKTAGDIKKNSHSTPLFRYIFFLFSFDI